MGSFYTPHLPYDENTFLDNITQYNLSAEGSMRLELMRQIQLTQEYYFMGVPFPGLKDIYIAAGDTFQGNIIVPPMSYLLALMGFAFYTEGPEQGQESAEGFQLRIYDKGARMDTSINTQFMFGTTVAGQDEPIGWSGIPGTRELIYTFPYGPQIPDTPMVVLAPGQLQIEVTNRSLLAVAAQTLFHFAVPATRSATNETLVKGFGNVS
jgi:hypothetical protein